MLFSYWCFKLLRFFSNLVSPKHLYLFCHIVVRHYNRPCTTLKLSLRKEFQSKNQLTIILVLLKHLGCVFNFWVFFVKHVLWLLLSKDDHLLTSSGSSFIIESEDADKHEIRNKIQNVFPSIIFDSLKRNICIN